MSPRLNRCRLSSGFTLVELLIVVIILGILAAVAIPQFANTANESRESTLHATIARIRKSIELYGIQHNNTYPDTTIHAQLTGQTDMTGAPGTPYGPYFRDPFPRNPFNDLRTIKAVATMTSGADDSSGWIYATDKGDFRANNTGTGSSGLVYFDF